MTIAASQSPRRDSTQPLPSPEVDLGEPTGNLRGIRRPWLDPDLGSRRLTSASTASATYAPPASCSKNRT